ncbi:hypothetical protein [Corynebacterium sp. KPL2838]|uniref:hypothetical protein n=1 Tax=Corynebacterium sp. KPL2838 TaxID=3158316 RepID=UPI0032EBBFD6
MTSPNGNDFGGYNQQSQYNQYPAYSQPQQSRGNGAMIAAIILGVVALLAVAAAAFFFVQGNGDKSSATAQESQFQQKADSTSVDDKDDEKSSGSEATVTKTEQAPAPAPAQAPVSSGNGHSWGDYTSYYAATSKTSEAFAKNVYNTFMNNWVSGGGTDVTLSVYSPTTGGTYTMYCSGNSSRVSCTGGDRARVVIH